MDIRNIICEEDGSKANGNFDTLLGRKRARVDSNPDNNGSSGFTNYPDADRVKARVLHLPLHQVRMHLAVNITLPDLAERVVTNTTQFSMSRI